MNFIKTFFKILKNIEEVILITFISLVIVVSILQLILSFLGFGISWFDSLLKYLVLWVGMFAASLATSDDKHIKIDLVGRFTKGRLKTIINIVINIFSLVICVVLFALSIKYLATIEYNSTDPAPFLGIRKWILLLAVPIGFGLMSLKFFTISIKAIICFIQNKEFVISDDDISVTQMNKTTVVSRD